VDANTIIRLYITPGSWKETWFDTSFNSPMVVFWIREEMLEAVKYIEAKKT